MPRRKDPRAGLAQPRAPTAKTVTKRLRMEPARAAASEAAAAAAGQTWSTWVTEAIDLALIRGSTR